MSTTDVSFENEKIGIRYGMGPFCTLEKASFLKKVSNKNPCLCMNFQKYLLMITKKKFSKRALLSSVCRSVGTAQTG